MLGSCDRTHGWCQMEKIIWKGKRCHIVLKAVKSKYYCDCRSKLSSTSRMMRCCIVFRKEAQVHFDCVCRSWATSSRRCIDLTHVELYKHSVCSREVPVDPLPEEAWRCLLEPMPEVRKHPTTKSTCTLLVYPAIGCGA